MALCIKPPLVEALLPDVKGMTQPPQHPNYMFIKQKLQIYFSLTLLKFNAPYKNKLRKIKSSSDTSKTLDGFVSYWCN